MNLTYIFIREDDKAERKNKLPASHFTGYSFYDISTVALSQTLFLSVFIILAGNFLITI